MSGLQRFNPLLVLAVVSLAIVGGLVAWLVFAGRHTPSTAEGLTVYCAAALRPAVEAVAKQYEQEYGVPVRLQFGGSAALLSQIAVSGTGDLFVAGDVSHLERARKKGLVDEELPMAWMQPVLAVAKGNPKNLQGPADLARTGLRVALADPDQAEIGRRTQQVLQQLGCWDVVKANVTRAGVFKPTEPDVATDIRIGSVDAAVIWNITAARMTYLDVLQPPEFAKVRSLLGVGVLHGSQQPTAALHFARYLAAADRGLSKLHELGYQTIDGDTWTDRPTLTFFAGSVNRRTLDPIVKRFEAREGVTVNTVFNGCGILTAQMRSIEKSKSGGFPDVYMACDVYYLETVNELFQDAVNVSNTDIVLVVSKGNPRGIKTLADLHKPGVRVALGQPEKCTIGVLCKRLLEDQGLYDKLIADGNVKAQKSSSALLVPDVATGAVDAALAYRTDTLGEKDKFEVITIDSPLAKAVQPFSIARSSPYKYVGRRLLQTIAQSRDVFEEAGFNWQLDPASCPGACCAEPKPEPEAEK